MWKVSIDRNKCTNCGECVESCPGKVYDMLKGKIEVINEDECHGCHTCEATCPKEACFIEANS